MSVHTESPIDRPDDAQGSAPGNAHGTTHRQTFGRVLRAEWIKFRTLRSTWTSLVSVFVVMVGLSAIAAAVSTGSVSGHGGPDRHRDSLEIVLTGSHLAVLLLAVIGCLAGAREYGSRLISLTVAAVPRRWPVMLAKTLTLAAAVIPVALAGVFAAFFLGMAIIGASGDPTRAISDPGVTRVVIGTGLYLLGIALLGLGLGVLMRSTAASIGTLIGGVLIVPSIASALLPESWQVILKYLPTNAADGFISRVPPSDGLGITWGAIVFSAWVALAIGAATYSIWRRDV